MLDELVSVTYYAVFDGHGGADCAQFLRENLHTVLRNRLLDNLEGIKDADNINESISTSITRAFEEADTKYKLRYPTVATQCGATAVVVLIIGNKLVCANVGDARAILCRDGTAIDLSVDHKASRQDEQDRIKK